MDYSQSIQKTISYIDENLCNKLSLDELAGIAGFSKYHFLRLFKNETGIRLSEHIRNRRMAQAAKLLLYTQESIIDIAILFRFESQEAFTRAFRREYNLPPSKYRKTMSNLIRIKEVAGVKKNFSIQGWIITGTTPREYHVDYDSNIFYKGNRSVCIKGDSNAIDDTDYSSIMQQVKAKNYLGKRIRFSAFIKTLDVKEWCGLWMRINDNTANIVRFDNMQDRPIEGDNEWNYYSVVLDVPDNSSIINIGVLLTGTGTIWIDHVNFEVVDKSVETTDVDLSSELPQEPVNLSFEE